jgi:aldehyde:ferredoxin oxidoreductase
MKGVNNQIIEIDITSKKYEVIPISDDIYSKYLGGYGLGAWYLYTHQKPKVDPLGPDNILGIISGLFNCTNFPLSGRFMAVSKSPLTEVWADSNCGGRFGPKLMQSGTDAVFIKGIAEEPVYIVLEKGQVSFYSAAEIWGKSTVETESILKEKYKGSEVLSIGPAGENLSLFSCIITDYGRALGRGGLGAVMGSKKLKAIVAFGNKTPEFYDREAIKNIIRSFVGAVKELKFQNWHKYGTCGSNEASTLNGDAPIKNWSGIGVIDIGKENAAKLNAEAIIKDNVKSYACASCPIACGALIKRETRYGTVEGHRLEYEGAMLFGPGLMNNDLDSVVTAFEMCNKYGLDIMSTGAVIGFAMECFENGLITELDVGFKLNWGDSDAIVKLVHMIGKGEGFGKVLGLGVKKAAEIIGKGAEKYAIHVHGQELPAHDPRYMPSLATTYVADPSPGRHTAGGIGFFEGLVPVPSFDLGIKFEKIEKYKYTDKGKYQAVISNVEQVQNSLGFCRFRRLVPQYACMPYIDMIHAATGLVFTAEELYKTGERIQNLKHLFNLREGLKIKENVLPSRALGMPPQSDGPFKDLTVDLEVMLREYLEAMDWDLETGVPSKQKLETLSLNDMI